MRTRKTVSIIRWSLRLGFLLCFLLLMLIGCAFWIWRQSTAQVSGRIRLHGLHSPVEVVRDSIGVPHIFAETFDDAILAQGYITAQDRLWQMDLLRRLGAGELSELFGKRTLEMDRQQRILGIRQRCLRQETTLPEADQRCLCRYSEGVNDFLETHRNRLPVEFYMLGYRPTDWRPRDTLAIYMWIGKLLSDSWETDLMREALYQRLNRELVGKLLPEYSPNDVLVVGTDGSKPTTTLSSSYKDLVTATNPSRSRLECFCDPEPRLFLSSFRSPGFVEAGPGSNNWVVAGNRTADGKPILANDPHLPLTAPSIWYMTHLHVHGDLDVIGVSIPGTPGIVLGHNQEIAWGATNLMADVQDLYIEELHPKNRRLYRVNKTWQPIEESVETIRVRGGPSEIVKVRTTRHGPIVLELPGQALALHWTMLDGDLTYPIASQLDRARNWEEFQTALKGFAGPVESFVYADRNGNIGFLSAGRIPLRAKGDGTVPVPGAEGEYEWKSYIPSEQMPRVLNPPSGMIITANNRIVGKTYPYFLSRNWASPSRARRILNLLTSGSSLRVDDMLRIQGDVYSDLHHIISQRIQEVIKSDGLSNLSDVDRQRLKVVGRNLQDYDFRAQVQAVGTTLCEEFRTTYLEMILKAVLGDEWKIYKWWNEDSLIEEILRNEPQELLPKTYPSYKALNLACLLESLRRLEIRFGSANPQEWHWGNYLPIEFKHPLGWFWPLTRWLNTGPNPQPGTPLTVKQTTPVLGVSMRMVVDLGDFDRSLNNITLGQSGQPFSPHYRDQFQHWLNAKSFPMLFSRTKIDQQAASRLWLDPD